MHRAAWLAVAAVNGLVALVAGMLLILPLPGGAATVTLLAAGAAFQMVHALVVIALCALDWPRDHPAWLFLYGTLLFSGSLYLHALGVPSPILWLALLGGLFGALGWVLIVVAALSRFRP